MITLLTKIGASKINAKPSNMFTEQNELEVKRKYDEKTEWRDALQIQIEEKGKIIPILTLIFRKTQKRTETKRRRGGITTRNET